MVDVFTEIIIERPVGEVSKYGANPDNAPEWYVNIQSAEWQTEKPLRLGTRVAFKARFLGRELAYIYEITEFIPEKASYENCTRAVSDGDHLYLGIYRGKSHTDDVKE